MSLNHLEIIWKKLWSNLNKFFVVLALLTCLGVQMEGEKGYNANFASSEKVGVNIEAELGHLN